MYTRVKLLRGKRQREKSYKQSGKRDYFHEKKIKLMADFSTEIWKAEDNGVISSRASIL